MSRLIFSWIMVFNLFYILNVSHGDESISLLNSVLPPEFSNLTLPVENITALLQKKCKKNSGKENVLEDLMEHFQEMQTCFTNLFNITAMQEEIEIAKPIGELDEVFHSYCLKRPVAMDCLQNFSSKVEYCLDEDELKHKEKAIEIIKQIVSFICIKDGDHIALFIAEKGPECFKSATNDLNMCVNKTIGYSNLDEFKSFNSDLLSKITSFSINCSDVFAIEKCVVSALEKCKEITPANIVESLFRYVRKSTICNEINPPHAARLIASTADNIKSTTVLSLFTIFTLVGYLMKISTIKI